MSLTRQALVERLATLNVHRVAAQTLQREAEEALARAEAAVMTHRKTVALIGEVMAAHRAEIDRLEAEAAAPTDDGA